MKPSCAILLLVLAATFARAQAQNVNTLATPPTRPPDPMSLLDDTTKLNVGDQITFRVVEDQDPAVPLQVMDSGEVEFPYLGRFPVAGKTCHALALDLKKALEKDLYYHATVMIAIDAQRKSRGKIYLFGGIARQGPLDIPVDEIFTLSKAVVRAGGLVAGADRTSVRIERKKGDKPDEKQTITTDLSKVLDQGRTDLDPILEPNDVVIVSQLGSLGKITVVGKVGRPGVQEIPPGEPYTASKAIMAAGGFADFANKGKVKIVRKTGPKPEDKTEILVDVGAVLEKGEFQKDAELKDGDFIIVQERIFNFN
ncbi:MAG: SLBB domain-containing protein [Methylacidiphilales bacterium]|nr:SLBB domain-containing protein [Candidatus Methylacidiphilales bacterium]